MAIIATGNHPKALWPGVHAWTHREYKNRVGMAPKVFDVRTSEKAYEELVEATGFGPAMIKAEGGAVSYESHSQGPTTRFTHVAYGLGYIVTKEELADNLYAELARMRSTSLAYSFATTKETVAANVMNRAFLAGFTGGDGQTLCSTTHPVYGGGTQSNRLAVDADLSEASLEDMLILIGDAKNNRNLRITLTGKCLIVPNALQFEAERILGSTLRPGTANNDVNAMRSMGMLPEGVKVWNYLSDDDAWFVQTDCPHGLIMFGRNGFEFTRDNDFDTDNAKAKGYERYSVGWGDWRGVFGTEGAA
jgi:hypothetical protein